MKEFQNRTIFNHQWNHFLEYCFIRLVALDEDGNSSVDYFKTPQEQRWQRFFSVSVEEGKVCQQPTYQRLALMLSTKKIKETKKSNAISSWDVIVSRKMAPNKTNSVLCPYFFQLNLFSLYNKKYNNQFSTSKKFMYQQHPSQAFYFLQILYL